MDRTVAPHFMAFIIDLIEGSRIDQEPGVRVRTRIRNRDRDSRRATSSLAPGSQEDGCVEGFEGAGAGDVQDPGANTSTRNASYTILVLVHGYRDGDGA